MEVEAELRQVAQHLPANATSAGPAAHVCRITVAFNPSACQQHPVLLHESGAPFRAVDPVNVCCKVDCAAQGIRKAACSGC